jgi:murein L,D-transpeptidase YafK
LLVWALKAKRQMFLMKGDRVLHEYRVALGLRPVGKKTQHGDYKTPEGN